MRFGGYSVHMGRRNFVSVVGGLVFSETVCRLNTGEKNKGRPILVEAGRRVDAPDATVARFPSEKIPEVRSRIRQLLKGQRPRATVSAAACGADLLLLEVAGDMRVPRYVLLPSAPEEFRLSSVTDRPGDWGDLYTEALRTSNVEVLQLPDGQEGYLATNLKLLDRAEAIAKQERTNVKALVVWNKEPRGPDDVTAHFLQHARLRGMPVLEISTV